MGVTVTALWRLIAKDHLFIAIKLKTKLTLTLVRAVVTFLCLLIAQMVREMLVKLSF